MIHPFIKLTGATSGKDALIRCDLIEAAVEGPSGTHVQLSGGGIPCITVKESAEHISNILTAWRVFAPRATATSAPDIATEIVAYKDQQNCTGEAELRRVNITDVARVVPQSHGCDVYTCGSTIPIASPMSRQAMVELLTQ